MQIVVKGMKGEDKYLLATALLNWLAYVGFNDVMLIDSNDNRGKQVPLSTIKNKAITIKVEKEDSL